jgi:glycosyltransferase involved in cell wall biosynthesis
MTPTPSYVAVVPAYNEASTIAHVIRALHDRAPEFDVLVVDDGSTDETASAARRAGARVLRLPFNLGIGGAVQAGFVFAREQAYDYMAQVDADGQHEPAELGNLIRGMSMEPEVDMVCGSRFLTRDNQYPAPLSRRTGIHIFAALLSRMVEGGSAIQLRDSGSTTGGPSNSLQGTIPTTIRRWKRC